ncbi:hypothetical protein PPBDW_I22174 [Photobacterium kishitanii]|nr:hypothetical protein PPBDW_I22174 [Photobacterium kishitanii]
MLLGVKRGGKIDMEKAGWGADIILSTLARAWRYFWLSTVVFINCHLDSTRMAFS